MKKWQDFLLWVLCFIGVDMWFDFIKSLIENGVLSKWAFPLIVFVMFVLGWGAVFFVGRFLKNKKLKKTESKESFWKWFIWFVLFLSVFMLLDIMRYSLENNMLNHWYFMVIGLCFMFTGWAGCRFDNVLLRKNK